MNIRTVLVLPASLFVVRTVPLAHGQNVEEQVIRALESLSPFPRKQLFYGYVSVEDESAALVYFGFRKNFSSEQQDEWDDFDIVCPSFIAWIGPVANHDRLLFHLDEKSITVAEWSGLTSIPSTIFVRARTGIRERILLDELTYRAESGKSKVEELNGEISVTVDERKSLAMWYLAEFNGEPNIQIGTTSIQALHSTDIRDKDEMIALGRLRRRSSWIWRGIVASMAVLCVAAITDFYNLAFDRWLKWERRSIARQAATIEMIQSELAMTQHLEGLANHSIRLYEILTLLNKHRPEGIEFFRFSTSGPLSVEVNAQTKNPDEIRQYEAELRSMPVFTVLRIDNLQTREGQTDFTVQAEFKQSALDEF